VLVQSDRIWVGLSRVNEFQDIPKKADDQDWDKLETTLKEHKASAFFADRSDVEIAAESTIAAPVKYQDIIHAMDVAVKVGFVDVGLSDPQGLACQISL
jgi:biopolymer transport protein ExbD